MRRLTPLGIIAALVLAAATALTPSQPAPEPCTHEGWPGGYHLYCIGGDPALVVRSMVLPSDPLEVLYELGASEAHHGELLRFRPVWREILTQEVLPMPEAEVWTWRPTAERPYAILRFPVAPPDVTGGKWGPDLVLLDRWDVWLPLVENETLNVEP